MHTSRSLVLDIGLNVPIEIVEREQRRGNYARANDQRLNPQIHLSLCCVLELNLRYEGGRTFGFPPDFGALLR